MTCLVKYDLPWQTSRNTELACDVHAMANGVPHQIRGLLPALMYLIHCHRRNRAYVDRAFAQPPSIDNAASHPFLRQLEAAEGGAASDSPVPGAAAEGASSTGLSRSATPVPLPAPAEGRRPPAPPPPPAAPPAHLFDLLSLDDVWASPIHLFHASDACCLMRMCERHCALSLGD